MIKKKKSEGDTNSWINRSPGALPFTSQGWLKAFLSVKCRKTGESTTGRHQGRDSGGNCYIPMWWRGDPVGRDTHPTPITSCLVRGITCYHHSESLSYLQNPNTKALWPHNISVCLLKKSQRSTMSSTIFNFSAQLGGATWYYFYYCGPGN